MRPYMPFAADCELYLLMHGISRWGSFGLHVLHSEVSLCIVTPTLRPMVELLMHSNVWYQAYVFKESANEVKVCIRFSDAIIPPYSGLPWACSNVGQMAFPRPQVYFLGCRKCLSSRGLFPPFLPP